MIPNINEVRQKTLSQEKINQSKKKNKIQQKIDELANLCKERAEKGYGYLQLEYPEIPIYNLYEIKETFERAGFVFNESIEKWFSLPDQVVGVYIEWKRDDFYSGLFR